MASKGRNGFRGGIMVVLLTLLALLAWLWWRGGDVPQTAVPSTMPATAARIGKAAPVATWTLGSVTLHACSIGGTAHGGRGASVKAWCAEVDVPEDRAHPHGRHIQLNLAIVRSASAKAESDMVVMLAGGPGQAATDSAHVARMFPALHKHHHFLLLDQRGTGQSNPLRCESKDKAATDKTAFDELDSQRMRRQAEACLKRVREHADPRFYTTTAAVADLEAVRQALGAPRFDLVGTSYGTRVALQYLRAHPEGVRSVVLDSPLPNQVVAGQDFARNLQQALQKDFALCTREQACHKHFGDPMHTLGLLRQALAVNPHQVGTRDPWTFQPEQRPLTEQTLASVVRLFAYSRVGIALLPLTIDAAAHGDVGPLLGQYALLSESLSGQHLAKGMNWSVVCSEDVDLMRPRQSDADTLLGNDIVNTYQAICSVWPHGTRPANFHAPVTSDKPVLIFSGTLDPVTPPAYGKMLLAHLGNARQLIVKGHAHALVRVDCVRQVMGQFIRAPDPDTLDTSCLKPLRPPAPFIHFNGTAP